MTQAGAEFDERPIISEDEQLDRAISLSLMVVKGTLILYLQLL